MINRKLNLDIPERITEFESLMKKLLVRKVLYKIVFRGKGLEFDSYRQFNSNDDASDIDWKASRRSQDLLVKQYIEERDLKIMIVVDISDNMIFGSTNKLKCEYAAELAATLGHMIVTSGDRLGFVMYSNDTKKMSLPLPGMKQFYIFTDELSNPTLYGGRAGFEHTLNFLLNYLEKSVSVVIFISDFMGLRKDIEKDLNLFARSFETIALMVRDPLDSTLPNFKGELVLEDPITGEQIIVDPRVAKKSYEKYALEQEELVKDIFKETGIDFLSLSTQDSFPQKLAEFLNSRVERRKYVVPR